MAAAVPNHGSPKYLFRPAELSDAELEAFAAWFVDKVLDNAARGPLTCPQCGGTEVSARNGTPPVYRCACGHRWYAQIALVELESSPPRGSRSPG